MNQHRGEFASSVMRAHRFQLFRKVLGPKLQNRGIRQGNLTVKGTRAKGLKTKAVGIRAKVPAEVSPSKELQVPWSKCASCGKDPQHR